MRGGVHAQPGADDRRLLPHERPPDRLAGGVAHFREHLADHDTANDTGGWQWAASTGTDAQPYFRIFNPTTQGECYDPDAEYIGRYVPELADVPAERIHAWPDLTDEERREVSESYPHPIVDHGEAREAAFATFERARRGPRRLTVGGRGNTDNASRRIPRTEP